VVAVNPGSLSSHQKWAEANGFGFPICVDEDKKVATAYGALGALGGIQRCVIVVNKRGKVTWSQEGLPDTADILKAIDDMANDDPDSSRLSSS
jgi:thioredoxin-dependent peroxiredoxin